MKLSNGKQYSVSSKYLENEMGDPVSGKDLFVGNSVIWKSKGAPYQVLIIATSSSKTICMY